MGWKKMKLGEVLKNREGRYKPNDPTIAGLKRIDKINFSGQIFLSDKGSNTDMILIKKGDLVISGINVEKGALAVYEGEEDILATIHYSSYIFDTDKIDIDFLKVFLRSPDFIQLLKEQVPGGIKTEIKPKHILPLEVYFPETTMEQKAIAEHFFEKEAKLKQLNEHLAHQLTLISQLEQTILQEAVQGKLVPQDPNDEPASELLKRIKAERQKSLPAGAKRRQEKPLPPIKPEEIPFQIPENWVWCRLGEIAESTSGGTPDRSNPKFWKGNINWLKSGELNDGFINDESEEKITEEGLKNSSAKLFPKGTLLIALYGATAGKLGILNFESTTNQAVCGFFENKYYDTKYLFYYLWAFRSKIIEDSWGQAQPNISQTYLKNFPFALPPLSEQKRIVAEIEKQFALTKQLKEHIIANQQATEQLLKALLHQAFEVKEMEKVKS
jgi:type I restriction enzyme S subunit